MKVKYCDLKEGDIFRGFGGVEKQICMFLTSNKQLLLCSYIDYHAVGSIMYYMPHFSNQLMEIVVCKKIFKKNRSF